MQPRFCPGLAEPGLPQIRVGDFARGGNAHQGAFGQAIHRPGEDRACPRERRARVQADRDDAHRASPAYKRAFNAVLGFSGGTFTLTEGGTPLGFRFVGKVF